VDNLADNFQTARIFPCINGASGVCLIFRHMCKPLILDVIFINTFQPTENTPLFVTVLLPM
jgi:hypothetical protein